MTDRADIPEGYEETTLDPLVKEISYEAFAEGREVVYVETRQLHSGKDDKRYEYHIVQNDAGVRRGLWGSAMLTALLRRVSKGSLIFLKYNGKSEGRNKRDVHHWTVAVKSGLQSGRTFDESDVGF